jgi:hypothetical protein
MKPSLPHGPAIALVTFLCLSLGACSSGADSVAQANDFAIRACTAQTVQPREGFNLHTASISELSQLADTAIRRSELADQAAALNEEWLLLSEVSADIAAFAQKILEDREDGAISLNMWDDYKTASNTYLAECQSALENVSDSLQEMSDPVATAANRL